MTSSVLCDSETDVRERLKNARIMGMTKAQGHRRKGAWHLVLEPDATSQETAEVVIDVAGQTIKDRTGPVGDVVSHLLDPVERMEAAADAWADDNVTGDSFKCGCGRTVPLSQGHPGGPSPYSPPICGVCLEDMMKEAKAEKRVEADRQAALAEQDRILGILTTMREEVDAKVGPKGLATPHSRGTLEAIDEAKRRIVGGEMSPEQVDGALAALAELKRRLGA